MEAQYSLNFFELVGLAILGYLAYMLFDLTQTATGTTEAKEQAKTLKQNWRSFQFYVITNMKPIVGSVIIIFACCYFLTDENIRPKIIEITSLSFLDGDNPAMAKPCAFFCLGLFNSVLLINLRKIFAPKQIKVE